MTVFLAIALQAVPLVSLPPANWSPLAELPMREGMPSNPDLSYFVRDEVRAGRCAAGQPRMLRVDLAVLIDAAGNARRIVPRAIGCATVEQYAAGLFSRLARGRIGGGGEGWYRTTMTFAWSD